MQRRQLNCTTQCVEQNRLGEKRWLILGMINSNHDLFTQPQEYSVRHICLFT
jgi:hypothetical protein